MANQYQKRHCISLNTTLLCLLAFAVRNSAEIASLKATVLATLLPSVQLL
jgi:hypothetical protein